MSGPEVSLAFGFIASILHSGVTEPNHLDLIAFLRQDDVLLVTLLLGARFVVTGKGDAPIFQATRTEALHILSCSQSQSPQKQGIVSSKPKSKEDCDVAITFMSW